MKKGNEQKKPSRFGTKEFERCVSVQQVAVERPRDHFLYVRQPKIVHAGVRISPVTIDLRSFCKRGGV